MSDHRTFRGSARATLGVELEMQLVDARTLALAGAGARVLAATPPEIRDAVKPEFHECCIEINSGVGDDVDGVGRDLAPKLDAVARVAAGAGARLAWGGTHPFSHWRDQVIVPAPRYLELANHYRETLCRQLTFGLHVHVGVGDGEAAVRACNRIGEHLPALLAASANSPFWCGRATGLRSHRSEVMGPAPTGGPFPRTRDWEDYVCLIDRLIASGVIRSTKDLWWDVRPSPALGTVEVRACDMPPDLGSALGLAALIQCLVVDLSRGEGPPPASGEFAAMATRQNRWWAARFGLEAEFVDPRTGHRSPARQVIRGLAGRLRGVAEELGCVPHLEGLVAMADGPGGAGRQLAEYGRTGDLLAVARLQAGGPAPSTAPADPAPRAATWPVPSGLGPAMGPPGPSIVA